MNRSIGFGFSENLFWDADVSTLDIERHRRYIVARVLEHGTLADWETLCRLLPLPEIVTAAMSVRSLDGKAAAFLAVVAHVPRESSSTSTTPKTIPCRPC